MRLIKQIIEYCSINRWRLPLIVGIVSLVATLVSFQFIKNYQQSYVETNIEDSSQKLVEEFNDRVNLYKGAVYGALGLFNASQEVTREEWFRFVDSSKIKDRLPGVLGLGFSKYFKPENLAVTEQEVRNDGFPDFKVFPDGARSEYTSIIYIEPFDQRNQRAFGYDMFTESSRRQAMETARDSGSLALTGKVTLLQQEGENSQSAFYIYMPLYEKNSNPVTVEERRSNLIGYIYSPIFLNEFIQGIKQKVDNNLEFQIFEGNKNQISSANLLYDTNLETSRPGYIPKFAILKEVELGGKIWTIRLVTNQNFGLSPLQKAIPYIVFILGLILTIGLVMLVCLSNRNSLGAFNKLTEELNSVKEKLSQRELVIDSEPFALIATNTHGLIRVFNREAEKLLGYSEEEAMGKLFFVNLLSKTQLAQRTAQLIQETGVKVEPSFDVVVTKAIIDGQDKTEWVLISKNNQALPVTLSIKPLFDNENRLLGYEFVI